MTNNKKKVITVFILTFALFISCAIYSVAFAEITNEEHYYLLNTEYEVDKTYDSVTVKDPENKSVSLLNQKFILTKEGKYTVSYSNKTVYVYAYKNIPNTKFEFEKTLEKEYGLNEKICLPKAKISSSICNYTQYKIIVENNDKIIKVIESENDLNFEFLETGSYNFIYKIQDVFGYITTDFLSTECKDKPIMNITPMPNVLPYNVEYSFGDNYCFYKGTRGEIKITITDPDSLIEEALNNKFIPRKVGKYNFNFSCNVDGNKLERNQTALVNCNSASLFSGNSGISEITANVDLPDYSKKGNGLKIIADSFGAIAEFNNIIDLNSIDENTDFLTFQMLSGSGYTSLESLEIDLVDAYQPRNFITLKFTKNPWTGRCSYISVGRNGLFMARSNEKALEGKIFKNEYGAVLWDSSFAGNENSDVSEFSFQIDYSNKQIFATTSAKGDKFMVLDLDDPNMVGINNVWEGFTNGEIITRIKIDANKKSGLIVTSIAGTSLSNDYITDSSAPLISVNTNKNYLTNMPYGIVNKAYAIPVATARDIVSGKCDIERKLYFLGLGNMVDESKKIINDSFVADNIGKYKLQYNSIDLYGNKATKECFFEVLANNKSIDITYNFENEIALYSYVKIPEPIITGVSGDGIVKEEIIYNGKVINLDYTRFIYIDNVGSIKIKTIVQDYLLQEFTKEFSYDIKSSKIIMQIPGLMGIVKSGEEIILPDFTAIDSNYELGDINYYPKKSIQVTQNGTVVTLDKSRKFIINDKKEVKIDFIASEGAKKVSKTYVIPVKEINGLNDFFVYDSKKFTSEISDDCLTFITNENGEIALPYALVANDLTLKFNTIASKINYDYFDIVLEDFNYASQNIFFRVLKKEKDSVIKVNGQGAEYKISGLFNDDSLGFNFIFDNFNKKLLNLNASTICQVNNYSNGVVFNGFSDGIIRLKIRLGNVTGKSALSFVQVSNQIFSRNNWNEIEGDRRGPAILFDERMENKRASINAIMKVSKATFFDVLNPKGSLNVSIINPNGDYILKNENCDTTREIKFDNYGFYTIKYLAYDEYDNMNQVVFKINVVDEIFPTIKINGDIQKNASVGSELLLPTMDAEDNLDKDLEKYIIILTPDFKSIVVKQGEKFKFDARGIYKIKYIAIDDSYNMAEKIFIVEVKESK